MTDKNQRVLAQWRFVHGREAEPYDSGMFLGAVGRDGRTWRLWKVVEPAADDPFPAGLRLSPVDAPNEVTFIKRSGSGRDLDMASLHIASREEVRANADAVYRELGLSMPRPRARRCEKLRALLRRMRLLTASAL